jgi:hypothetical protein
LVFAAAAQWMSHLLVPSDTAKLVAGASNALDCLDRGQFTNCAGAMYFPLLQYLPAIVFQAFGTGQAVARWLAVLNLFTFLVILWWAWRSLERWSGARVACLFVCLIASGPLLAHARTSYSETLGVLVTLGLVIRAQENAGRWSIFGWMFFAGISKETAAPFLVGLALLASWLGSARLESPRKRAWIPIVLGAVAAVAVNMGFNYFRFGVPWNRHMLQDLYFVKEIGDHLSFSLGIWLSPNGGVLFFWPIFFLLCLVAGVFALRGAWSGQTWRTRLAALAPAAGVAAVLGGLTLGFGRWFAPLGWESWGPRLMFPWLPAAGYLLVLAYGKPLGDALAALGRRWWLAALLALLWVAVSLPEIVYVFQPEVAKALFSNDPTCPRPAVIEADPNYYYHCLRYGLWSKKSVLWEAYGSKKSADVVAYLFAWSVFLGITVYRALRLEAARAEEGAARDSAGGRSIG